MDANARHLPRGGRLAALLVVLAVVLAHGVRPAQAQSSDAALSGLTGATSTDGSTFTGPLGLDPAFDAATTQYTAVVANDVTHIQLTPAASHSGAAVKAGIDGTALATVTSGSPSAAISVDVGANAITVEVTAEDSTTREYALAVWRLDLASHAAGSLDVSFGGDGKVTSGLASAESKINAVAVQSDGKIVAAGSSMVGSNVDFAVVRYTAAGALDTSFGDGDGLVTTSFGHDGTDTISAVAVLSDGKILAAGYAYNGTNLDFALARYTAAGVLDTTFGTGGKVITPIGSSMDHIRALAVQSDGKIVVAGNSHNGTNYDFAVARYTAAGVLDTGFSTDGKVTTAIGSGADTALAVAVQSDGKIVAAGHSHNGTNEDFALVRYTSTGALDTGFDTDGKVTTTIGSGNERAHGVAVLTGGEILAGGLSATPSPSFNDFALVRYTSAGALDTTFGTTSGSTKTGKITHAIGTSGDYGLAMVAQSGGKILVGGYAHVGGSDYDFALARFTALGALDTSFDSDGKVITDMGAGNAEANALAVGPDGEIVLAGFSHNGTHNDFALVRYTTAGALDTSFDSDGKVTTDAGVGHSYGDGLALQPDGKIVVVGNVGHPTDFGLTRYNPDGTVDLGFGQDGKVITDFNGGAADFGAAVAVQPDGKIVATGRSNKGAVKDFAVARYNPDGSLDSGFGTGGKVTTDLNSSEDRPYAVAVQPDGKVVVAGYVKVSSTDWDFAMVRYTAAGALDSSFDSDGKVITALTTGNDQIRALAVLSDGKILAAGRIGGDFGVARYTTAGELDATFGGDADNDNTPDGYITTAVSTGDDAALAIAVQPDGKIVVTGGAFVSGDYDFAVVRYTAAGALDATFGGDADNDNTPDGYITTAMSANRDIPYGLVVQEDGKIVVAGWAGSTAGGVASTLNFALARYTAAGTLDTEFGTGGKVITAMSAGDDRAYGAVLQGDGKLVAAGLAHSGKAYQVAVARYHLGVRSANADLSALVAEGSTDGNTFTPYDLSPAFDNDTTDYTATVDSTVTSVRLTPTASHGAAAVKVGKQATTLAPVASGSPSAAIDVDVGDNAIDVEVTAQNGATKTYTVTVTRPGTPLVSLGAAPNPVAEGSAVTITATLSAALSTSVTIPVTLSPGSAETNDYGSLADITIPSGSTSGTAAITTSQDADADHETFTVALGALPNTVAAGSPDSVTVTITDDEAPSDNADLIALAAKSSRDGRSFSALALAPAFAPATTRYEATVASYVTHVKLAPTVADTATVQAGKPERLATVASGSDSPAIALDAGHNTILVVVTAEDGTTKWHNLAVTRGRPPTVSLIVSPNPVQEGTPITVTAVLSAALSSDVTIPLTITRGSTETGDIGRLAGITITAGSTTGTGTITTTADTDADKEVFAVVVGRLPPSLGPGGLPYRVTVAVTESAPAVVPGQPFISTITPGDSALTVEWTFPRGNPTGYDVQYKTSAAATWTDATHTGTDRTITITGLVNGMSYDVRVRATNANGAGEWSRRFWGTPEMPRPPGVPKRAHHRIEPGDTELTVSWILTAGAPTGYDVEYRVSTAAAWTDAGHTGDTRTITITGLVNGTTYDVRVRATNANGAGEWSTIRQGTPQTATS